MPTNHRVLTPAILGLLTALLYLPRLGDAPLTIDEVILSLEGHSIATTGHDLRGRLLPVYFEYSHGTSTTWFPPVLIYGIALAVKLLPFSEAAVRVPMVIVGIASVVLVYWIGKELFASELLAILASVLLAFAPAHFIHSRFAMDYICGVPFALAWLLCLLRYVRRENPRVLVASGLALGIGVYTYIASMLVMPLCALLTGWVLYRGRAPRARYGLFAAGLLAPLVVFAAWLLFHPAMLDHIVMKYRVDDAKATPADALKGFAATQRLSGQIEVYASFLHPRFLFVDGSPKAAFSTRLAGVFVLPVAGMLVVGLARVIRERLTPPGAVLLAGFLAIPAIGSLVPEDGAIFRVMPMVPFGVLLAVHGLDEMMVTLRRRVATLTLLASSATVIWIALTYHAALPHAQGLIRAVTVPLAVGGLSALLARWTVHRATLLPLTALGLATIVGTDLVAYYLEYSVWVRVSTAVLIVTALWMLASERVDGERRFDGLAAVLWLAVASSVFLFFYCDYGVFRRVAFVPATAVRLVARFVHASCVFVAILGLRAAIGRTDVHELNRPRFAMVLLGLALTQTAYFYFGLLPDSFVRFVGVSAVLLTGIGLALLLRGVTADRFRFAAFAVVATLSVSALQFAGFYRDYFNEYRTRSSFAFEGNIRGALERVIARDLEAAVPAIYLGSLTGHDATALYWKFSLIKHRREDLLARTFQADPLIADPDRIQRLPPRSLLVTTAGSGIVNGVIERLVRAGELKPPEAIRDPDGRIGLWILER